MSSKRYSRDIKEISSDFPFPWGVSNANMVFCSRTLYPKQLRLCLSMLVGQCCLTIYLLNSFLCCHIIVIAPDLWDIIISFNTSLQKQALPAVRRVLYLALCVVGRSEFPLWGPLTLTHRQRVTQSLPNTLTHSHTLYSPEPALQQSEREQTLSGKEQGTLYRQESEWDGERESERNPRIRKTSDCQEN